jgi:hypothetical protein
MSPMLVTELGMVTEFKEMQFENALSAILVTELGILTDVIPSQFANPKTLI